MLLPETLALHDREKFEFHYIYFLPWKDQMVEAIRQAGGKVSCFEANNNLQILRQRKKIIRYIKGHQIQVIHAHLPWAGFLARLIHRATHLPTFYTEHNKQERYHRLTYFLNKLTFNWQTMAIAVSTDVEASIQAHIRPQTPVRVILNGVNTDKFQRDIEKGNIIRQEHKIPKEAFVVGTIAVFRFQKRLKEWLQVFAKAAQANPDLYGIIVGDGPLKEELLEERKRLGLEHQVIMPGLQTNTIDWFSAMDAYMMTSVFEGLPIALLEAMSMECAVLTTDAGGTKEVIRPDLDGVMVGVDKWEQLGEHLHDLSKDKPRVEALGKHARMRVVERFSLMRMVGELEEVYGSN